MLPHVVLDADLREYRIDTAWRDRLHSRVQGEVKVHAGGLVLRPTVVRTTDEKRALHTRTSAAAVDMESAAIADVAHQAALPMLVIRAVADTQALSIPRFVVEASDPYGHIRVSGIVSGLLREPLALSRLLYLQRASSAALNTLRKVVQLAGPDF